MFDRLDDILVHYEELMQELNNPSVAEDQNRFRKLMKEQSDLSDLVETYTQYKKAKQAVEDSLLILDEENDEDMREMAKEELGSMLRSVLKLTGGPSDSSFITSGGTIIGPRIRSVSMNSAHGQYL